MMKTQAKAVLAELKKPALLVFCDACCVINCQGDASNPDVVFYFEAMSGRAVFVCFCLLRGDPAFMQMALLMTCGSIDP